MELQWTEIAKADLRCLYAILAMKNPMAAARAMQILVAAPEKLLVDPRIGKRLEQFAALDVRRIIVGQYELRYELLGSTVVVLRVWHGREDR